MRGLLRIIKNKFFVVTLLFAVWVGFFAQYDLMSQREHMQELAGMKAKMIYLEETIARLEKERESLRTDSAVIEQYARERYFMKTPHEDVYVFDTLQAKKP
ncbi:MAG: septum formation initiator family protein [Chitinophagaceae bacterium]|nr:septum formation initiator family protein [Chitinophagaceae bacterium]